MSSLNGLNLINDQGDLSSILGSAQGITDTDLFSAQLNFWTNLSFPSIEQSLGHPQKKIEEEAEEEDDEDEELFDEMDQSNHQEEQPEATTPPQPSSSTTGPLPADILSAAATISAANNNAQPQDHPLLANLYGANPFLASHHARAMNPLMFSSQNWGMGSAHAFNPYIPGFPIDPFLVAPVMPSFGTPASTNNLPALTVRGSPTASTPEKMDKAFTIDPALSVAPSASPSGSTRTESAAPPAKRQKTSASGASKKSLSVDTSAGSMIVDKSNLLTPVTAGEDKRRRNTAASARFRLKKKEREVAMEKKAKDLEDKVTDLERECEVLRKENGWLKGLVVGATNGDPGTLSGLGLTGSTSNNQSVIGFDGLESLLQTAKHASSAARLTQVAPEVKATTTGKRRRGANH